MPWPRGVTNFAQYVHDYNVMLYENDDNYEDDAQDLHMFGIKVNGCQGTFHKLQMISWAMITVQLTIFFALMAPMMRDPGNLILQCGGSALVVLIFIGNLACTLTQSADENVFSEKRWTYAEYEEYITAKWRDSFEGDLFEGSAKKAQYEGVRDGTLRFCPFCHVIVKKQAYHCHSSNKCVEGMDHFCKWLNTSVGTRNYPYFAMFVVCCFWTSILQFAVCLFQFVDSFSEPDFYETRLEVTYSNVTFPESLRVYRAFIFIGAALSIVAIGQLGYLYGFHVMLFRLDITTAVYWQHKRDKGDEADAAETAELEGA